MTTNKALNILAYIMMAAAIVTLLYELVYYIGKYWLGWWGWV